YYPRQILDLLEAYWELGIQGFDEYLQQCFLENHGEWIRDNLLLLERFSSKHEVFRDIRNFCYDQLCQNSDIEFIIQWAFSQFPDISRENIENLKEVDVEKLQGGIERFDSFNQIQEDNIRSFL
ncbi:2381_t:CDS:2, partial [Acaulospora morrowiae]